MQCRRGREGGGGAWRQICARFFSLKMYCVIIFSVSMSITSSINKVHLWGVGVQLRVAANGGEEWGSQIGVFAPGCRLTTVGTAGTVTTGHATLL